jgi:hypothetical protein
MASPKPVVAKAKARRLRHAAHAPVAHKTTDTNAKIMK